MGKETEDGTRRRMDGKTRIQKRRPGCTYTRQCMRWEENGSSDQLQSMYNELVGWGLDGGVDTMLSVTITPIIVAPTAAEV